MIVMTKHMFTVANGQSCIHKYCDVYYTPVESPVVCGNPEKPDMREIPEIPESVDELEGVGDGVALLVPDDVCICCGL